MENTGIKSEVIDEICGFAKMHGINKVVLFGSRARGDYQRASDIDLAVSGGNIDGFTVDIKEKTSTLLQYDVIDLSQDIQDRLLKSISKEGVIIYEKV